jgi:lon-related putative ATP-dependent protease
LNRIMTIKPLPPEALYRTCDPEQLDFRTTAEVEDLSTIIGQDRAVAAAKFGVGIRRPGYNLFALGPSGTGKHTTLRTLIEQKAAEQPVPSDWVYVNNFDEKHRPRAIALPAGRGTQLRDDMEQLIEDLKTSIPAVFESDDYASRKQTIDEEFKEKQENAFEQVQQKAEARHIALIRTPVGLALAPVHDGEVVKPEVFKKLPQEERDRIEADIEELQEELQQTVRKVPQWDKERRDKVRELNREVSSFAVTHFVDALKERYADLEAVVGYLSTVSDDIVHNVEAFIAGPQQAMPMLPGMPAPSSHDSGLFRQYQVNVVVDHGEAVGASVVFEDNPNHANLVGRVEHLSEMGALVTDFSLIKAGALHRANGGYLMLDARRLLMQPYAYEALKRCLRSGEVRIESLGQMLSLITTVSLEPEPIPLDVKVVLVGERILYYLLCQYDPDFSELFKVAVDFDDVIDQGTDMVRHYAALIATLARREKLRTLDREAVARVIEQGTRLADDQEKITAQVSHMVDLVREADYWAHEAGREVIAAEDVQTAIDAQIHRLDRIRARSQEMIERGLMLIDTGGSVVGQINGLSVLMLGTFSFGRPSRITARVRMGSGEVVDIERKVDLGGPIHSKGVLILSAFLGARYAQESPLSLSASLVFEQSYGGVDGDSASSAELYALLSALSGYPIDQSFAVTGSVNQHGRVQAIGGVNEKIEGFFDLCQARGLTGTQGVLIPESNVKHLMLRRDVITAVERGEFAIYPIATIDQGIEILTGKPAGERDGAGQFPPDSVNGRVEARLHDLAQARKRFGAAGRDGKGSGEADKQAPPPEPPVPPMPPPTPPRPEPDDES